MNTGKTDTVRNRMIYVRFVKEEYLIILGSFSLFLNKDINYGYPQHTFLWRNKENYPRIIAKYQLLNLKCPGGRVVSAPSSDHKVVGSNLARGGIHLLTVQHYILQILSLSPFHRLDMT